MSYPTYCRRWIVSVVVSLLPLAAAASEAKAVFATPSELAARVVENAHVELTWRNNASADGGVWVEFSTPGEDFLKMEPLPREVTTYRHVNVASESTYQYRLLPFFGAPSAPVTVTTGAAPATLVPGEREGPLPADRSSHGTKVDPQSLRDPVSMSQAAPLSLMALSPSPTTVDLRWIDRASDEDAYLVEIAAQKEGPFAVCALLEPNATSFRKMQLPEKTTCYFRVRACFYGKPSNVTTINTGKTTPKL